jgi:hypothetical protein
MCQVQEAIFFFFFFYFLGVRWVSPLGTPTTNWPIVPPPHDRWWWMWSSWWNENWQGKQKYSKKTCPNATLSTTNCSWLDEGSNPRGRGGKPPTNRPSNGKALSTGSNAQNRNIAFIRAVRHITMLTLRSRILLKKPKVVQLFKDFPNFRWKLWSTAVVIRVLSQINPVNIVTPISRSNLNPFPFLWLGFASGFVPSALRPAHPLFNGLDL